MVDPLKELFLLELALAHPPACGWRVHLIRCGAKVFFLSVGQARVPEHGDLCLVESLSIFRTHFAVLAAVDFQLIGHELENRADALAADGDYERVVSEIAAYPDLSTDKLFFTDHAKLFTDGAFFSQLMMIGEPGYLDGHDGEWLMVPERFEEAARLLWHEGYKIHVHCTGDMGLELALDTLEKLQNEKPRFNHRFTIEHFGLSTPEQVRRMADLGAIASANVYYLHELSEIYAREALGEERAYSMARLGTLKRHNIPFALHSDYTMAPALPFNSAWVAATRINEAGKTVGEGEIVPLYDALKAITVDAAYVLGLEHEIGSLRAGKRADFTVLEQDPFEVGAEGLKDIDIWGTVFGGTPFQIEK